MGDLGQLVGPTRNPDLGIGEEGMIPLDILEGNEWIYESDYYRSLLDKANFDNPTKLVADSEPIQIQYACINRAMFPCKAKESFFVPNVLERTNGQLEIQVIGYPELGIAGPDTVQLVANGTLSFSEITGAYVGGDLPVLDMYYFWGLFSDRETDFNAVTAVIDDLDGYIEDATGGGAGHGQQWYEVAEYIVGPAISMPADLLIFNPDAWAELPEDFQQILIEEGARAELEELRMAPVWNATGLEKNIEEGMEHITWNEEIYSYILNEVVVGEMIPNWVNRVGGYDTDEVKLFNEKFGPIAGVKINPDGSATLIDEGGVQAQK